LDEQAVNKIQNDFKKFEKKMITAIRNAMYENNHQIYNNYRQEFAESLTNLEVKRKEWINNKRKKNQREKVKLLHKNSQERISYMATAINNTVKYFKKLYFPDDTARKRKLQEIVSELEIRIKTLPVINRRRIRPCHRNKEYLTS
jgi:hypothetical protein